MRRFHSAAACKAKTSDNIFVFLARTPVAGAMAMSTEGRWRSTHSPVPVVPCALNGGPFSKLLQQVIERKETEVHEEARAALQFLLELGAPAVGTVEKPSDDPLGASHHREEEMAGALSRLHRATALRQGTSPTTLSSLHYLERPAGCVLVPAVVGYVYMELLQRGYDAETWWKCHYRRFLQRHLSQPSTQHAVDEHVAAATTAARAGNSTAEDSGCARDGASSAVSRAAAVCDDDAVPALCWVRRPSGAEPARRKNGRVMYATPAPLFTDSSLRAPTDAIASAGVKTSTSRTWIPLFLISHLPFFPVPHPTRRDRNRWGSHTDMMRDAEDECDDTAGGHDEVGAVGITSFDAAQRPHAYIAEQQEREVNSLARPAGLHQRGRAAPSTLLLDGNLAGAGVHQSDRMAESLPPKLSWLHPFYDQLFSCQNTLQTHRVYPKQHSQNGSELADFRASAARSRIDEKRASCPLEAPWNAVLLLSVSTGAGTSFTLSSHPTDTVPQTGSKQALSFTTSADSASPLSSSPLWPRPLATLQLCPAYQSRLSSFWARKAEVLQHLPVPYFFPFSAYPFLASQINQEKLPKQKRRGGTRAAWTARMPAFAIPRRGTGSSIAHNSFLTQQLGGNGFLIRPDHANDGAFQRSQSADSSSPFAVLGPHWKAHAVYLWGRCYIPVTCTTLACFFDSSVCVQHAIPLDVFGSPLMLGLNLIRHRQQRQAPPCAEYVEKGRRCIMISKPAAGAAITGTRGMPAIAGNAGSPHTALTLAKDESVHTRSSRSLWLERLKRIQLDRQSTTRTVGRAHHECILELRDSQQSSCFLFRSPYWVEVENLYERWGAHVAPGVLPLRIDCKLYVNAEQTTDASRFTPATCVPHLQQEVLFCCSLFKCPWEVSQQLLSITAPEARPRQRGSVGVCVWTYQTLKERGAAAQRVTNLWIADEMMKKMGWSLRPVPLYAAATSETKLGGHLSQSVTETILHAELPLSVLKPLRLRARLEGSARRENAEQLYLPRSPNGSAAPHCFANLSAQAPEASQMRLSRQPERRFVTVFHSSCVTEQEQIAYVATYTPQVLLLRVPDVTEEELRYELPSSAVAMKPWLLRHIHSEAEGALRYASPDTEHTGWGARCAAAAPCTASDAEVGTQEVGKGWESAFPGGKEASHYLAAVRAKRLRYAERWKGSKLTLASRLDLAKLALQKGYLPENAHRWVSLDFLLSERRVRPIKCPRQTHETASPLLSPSSPEGASVSSAVEVDVGLTAIEVEVYSSVPRGDHDEVDGDLALMQSAGIEVKSNNGDSCLSMKMTLVNREELEWPSGLSPIERFMWLFRDM
ncbi:hypothetical protein ABL78_0456 [Leptomonas seymouri]|uniref:Uncharacterized protein n=1 Tax=Leptomonas seymouri TaxID=5684 RepID=A0A0N1PF94_LEPSE|nr:hypothetical protein ABL78_0456 [Leptomonas seymouri]|eukprot:KPI90380.1 hypothetical protein ABL78_0456 [Leptomonas seymouri]